MALTNAAKQARFRARHLGPGGDRHRLLVDISSRTDAQLKRLARHHGTTVREMIERLAAEADSALRAGMSESERRRYARPIK
jgi:hypothetical protein